MNASWRHQMKKGSRSVLILTAIWLTLVSAVPCAEADDTAITIYGAPEFVEMIQTVADVYMKEHPDVRVKLLGKTSDLGFQALLNKQADLVVAARKPTVVERSQAERKHVKWQGVRVAWLDVAVIIHPDILVGELTVDQLRKIYTGEFANWKDVGGPDLPINPHSMACPQNDVAVWFADTILSKAEFRSGIIWVNKPDFLVRHVSLHTGSIAYLGYLQLARVLKQQPRFKVRVLSMSKKTGEQAISPSAEISQKGDYPVTVPIFLFWDENNPDKRIEQFALFCQNRLPDAVGQIQR